MFSFGNRGSYTKEDLSKFRKEYREFFVKMIQKLLQRCPLKYDLVKGATCLDPKILLCTKNIGRLDLALEILVESDRVNGQEADNAKEDYSTLSNDQTARDIAKNFERSDRLDRLWFDKLLKVKESAPLKKVVSILLVLSHGQATVERGFSINKDMLVENQKEKSLIALKRVHDHISNLNVPLEDMVISKSLINAMRSAHSRYRASLDREKDEENKREDSKKREKERLKEKLDERIETQKRLKLDSEAIAKEIILLKRKL